MINFPFSLKNSFQLLGKLRYPVQYGTYVTLNKNT